MKKMNRLISWIYHSIFGGVQCDCCKKFGVTNATRYKNRNGEWINLCYKCTCAYNRIDKTINEMYLQLQKAGLCLSDKGHAQIYIHDIGSET